MKSASHQKTNTIWFHLCDVPREIEVIDKESRMVVDRGWGKEKKRTCLMSIEFQYCKVERVLEIVYPTT